MKVKLIILLVVLFSKTISVLSQQDLPYDDSGVDLEFTDTIDKHSFNADMDHEFDNGSMISLSSINEMQIESLRVLAKVWGFVKYYHPEVVRGNYQWDYELFRVIPQIMQFDDTRERNQYLTDWLRKMNTNLQPDENPLIFTAESYVIPQLDWINDDTLFGVDLVMELNRIKNSKRPDYHYYISLEGGYSFDGEKNYPHITWEDQGYRILSLFRFWNVIEYCFPYRDLTDLDWDRVLEKYLRSFIEPENETDYYKNLFALTAEINDSHGWIRPFSALKKNVFAALFLYLEDKMVVRKSYTCQLKAGDIILKINDRDVNDIIDERIALVCASNESRRKNFTVEEMNRWNEDSLKIVVVRDNDTISTYLTDFNLREPIPSCFSEIPAYDYQNELAKKNILYIPIGISEEPLAAIEDSIMYSDGIILDCRGYPAHESFYYTMSDILFPDSVSHLDIALLDIQHPGHFRLIPQPTWGRKNPDYYKKQVIILVDGSTQSAAETVVMIFQQAPNSITVGSQSSAANGGAVHYLLPGNFTTRFTMQGAYYPNKGQLQRIGVKIDVPISRSISLYLQGRDDQLEKAIELIN